MTPGCAEPTGLRCETLTPDKAAAVFPLLREVIPGLSLSAWLRHARRIAMPGRAAHSGIMTVRRLPRPMPCGLFVYQRVHDLEHGSVLVAEHMVAVDLLDPEPVMRALVAELEALAHRLGCGGIRTMVIGPDAPIAARLQAAGHTRSGEAMLKTLDTSPPRPRTKPPTET